MRSKLRVIAVVSALVVAGAVTVHLATAPAGDLPGNNLVTAAAADPTVPVAAPSTSEATTTTVDPAAVEAFLGAWAASETTTTTAPPPPPPPPPTTTTAPPPPPTTAAPAPAASGSGCVIPAYICRRESGFSYSALNPSSGAGGMYQFLPSTWNGIARQIAPQWVGTPPHLAPPAVQDQFAAYLWAGGAGCSHWSAC